jgi:hypothetical protein
MIGEHEKMVALLYEAFMKKQTVVITDQLADTSAATQEAESEKSRTDINTPRMFQIFLGGTSAAAQEAELEKIEADIDARLARIVELQAVTNQLREDSQRRSAALSQVIAEL